MTGSRRLAILTRTVAVASIGLRVLASCSGDQRPGGPQPVVADAGPEPEAQVGPPPPPRFELAIRPDTQYYTRRYPEVFTAQTRWIAEHAYGRVLSRPGLDGASRELVAVAALAALGHDRQLASHARGAVRCGARPGDVLAILDAVADLVPAERLGRARDIVASFAGHGKG